VTDTVPVATGGPEEVIRPLAYEASGTIHVASFETMTTFFKPLRCKK
jgi:hypothetical protein